MKCHSVACVWSALPQHRVTAAAVLTDPPPSTPVDLMAPSSGGISPPASQDRSLFPLHNFLFLSLAYF
ncbi:unnamed protein product [Spirodela intermedia]|uniref:Uncharacterized protein n=1 Tax=Spirodela intermedia TaxID=51605 RepID=A0A7I8ITS4_SPIIN|nr:unnamed protein product [Spirodela intermedia]CAA6661018.1 unnamed protein product [Spirodela intermedia]